MMARLALICAPLVVMLWIDALAAQDTETETRDAAEVAITRADLGWAYLRLERVYFANQPTDRDQIAEFNRAFDAASKKFFGRQFAATIQEVNLLTERLADGDQDNSMSVALSLKPIFTPPVLRLDQDQPVQLRLRSIYSVDNAPDSTLQVSLRPLAGGDSVVSFPLSLEVDPNGIIDTTVEIVDQQNLSSGAYSVILSNNAGANVDVGLLNVVSSSLDGVRQDYLKRLDEIETEQPQIASAVRACRDRSQLLQDEPSRESSSQFLSDLSRLAEQIGQEVERLESGHDPYRRRAGDYWRTFAASDTDKPLPARVYAPAATADDDRVPLVIAFHGAGGDENMFFTGYGAGVIKRLADQHRFLVVAPSTNIFAGRADRFDHLIAEIAEDYRIDHEAIYVIGHSMGGFTTAALLGKRSSKIAAACCIAGGGKPTSETISPLLIIAGELDSLIPITMLKPMAQQAIEAGMPVEFRQEDDYGHTLMVGAVLPEAVQWLLERRLAQPEQ